MQGRVRGFYALRFRELNGCSDFSLDVAQASRPYSLIPNANRATVLGGRGIAKIADGTLTVNVPEKLDFVWVKLEYPQVKTYKTWVRTHMAINATPSYTLL